MIIRCEECKSEFNLDETKLKENGSKVRCSVCESVFTVYPIKPDEVPEEDIVPADSFEETVALDSPPLADEGGFGNTCNYDLQNLWWNVPPAILSILVFIW